MAKQKNSYFLKSDLSVTEGDSQSTTSSTFTLVRLGETTLIKKVIKKEPVGNKIIFKLINNLISICLEPAHLLQHCLNRLGPPIKCAIYGRTINPFS